MDILRTLGGAANSHLWKDPKRLSSVQNHVDHVIEADCRFQKARQIILRQRVVVLDVSAFIFGRSAPCKRASKFELVFGIHVLQ